MTKKILIVYNEFPPIARDLARAFEGKGYIVDIFYGTKYVHWFYRKVIRVLSRWLRALKIIPKGQELWPSHPYNFYNYMDINFQKRCKSFRPDYLLVIHGLPFGHEFIGGLKIPKVGWWVEPNDELVELQKNASPFDIYNTFSLSSRALLQEINADSRYLCHAVSPEEFFPMAVNKDIDVLFVGNWSEWRDEVLLRTLSLTHNVVIYGPQWLKKSSIPKQVLQKIYRGPMVIGAELNHLFNRARVNLNASRVYGSTGLNMRFFEVLATRSLFITDFVPEIEKHFLDGQELAVYRTLDGLTDLLKKFLADEELSLSVAEAGYQKVLANHTYSHLASSFEKQFTSLI